MVDPGDRQNSIRFTIIFFTKEDPTIDRILRVGIRIRLLDHKKTCGDGYHGFCNLGGRPIAVDRVCDTSHPKRENTAGKRFGIIKIKTYAHKCTIIYRFTNY